MSRLPFILSTKLHIPASVDKLVPRERLMRLMDEGAVRKLTLIRSPAGSGKTTLLGEWAKRQRSEVAWVSLDEYDNDFRRFWVHVVAAIDRVQSRFFQRLGPALADIQPAMFQTLLVQMINELQAAESPLILILDDYHLLDNAEIHRSFAYFVERMPEYIRCIVSSRNEPPLPLPRLESRGQLFRIAGDQLNFTPEEGFDFCRLMDEAVPEQHIRRLHERTEGWVTGMKLALLTQKESPDYGRLLDRIADNNVKLSDYLFDEVYRHLPQSDRRFLLHTAVPGKICGPLCEAVTGQTGGRRTLERLGKANLFLISLDKQGIWYRYHHLFLEFLLGELEKREPALKPELHRRAAEWFRTNGFPEDAVEHYLAGRHTEAAMEVIERLLPVMIDKQWETLLRWISAIPLPLLEKNPEIYLSYTFFKLAAQESEVENLVERAERLLTQNGNEPEPGRARTDLASFHLIKALYAADYVRSVEQSIEHMRECVRLAPEGVPLQEIEINGGEMSILDAFRHMDADLGQIDRFFRVMIELWHREPPYVFTGFFHIGYGELLYERGELDGAEKQIKIGWMIARRNHSGKLLAPAASALSVIYRAKGRIADSDRILREAGTFLSKWGFAFWAEQLYMREIRFAAAEVGSESTGYAATGFAAGVGISDANASDPAATPGGTLDAKVTGAGKTDKIAQIEKWAEENARAPHDEDTPRHHELFAAVTLVRVQMALNRLDEAMEAIKDLELIAAAMLRRGEHQELMILEALCAMRQNRMNEAQTVLDRVLETAERNGSVRPFIDEGEPMVRLLECHANAGRGIAPFVRKLLEECRKAAAMHGTNDEPGSIRSILTKKERQVLELMVTGMPNRLIAERLNIKVGTLKTHINHIYQKLMVSDRWSAVSRANELMRREG